MKKQKIYGLVSCSYEMEVCVLFFLNKKEAEDACSKMNIILDKINNSYKYKLNEKQVQKEFKKLDKYLNNYYGGCGELTEVKVKELEPGKPFASWDLD